MTLPRTLPLMAVALAMVLALWLWPSCDPAPVPASATATAREPEPTLPEVGGQSASEQDRSGTPAPDMVRVEVGQAARAARMARYLSLLPTSIAYAAITDADLARVDLQALQNALKESGVSASDIRQFFQDGAQGWGMDTKLLAMLGMAWASGFGKEEADYLNQLAAQSHHVMDVSLDHYPHQEVFAATHVLLLRDQLDRHVASSLLNSLGEPSSWSKQGLMGSEANFVQMVLRGSSHADPAAVAIANKVMDGMLGSHAGCIEACRVLLAADPDAAVARLMQSADGRLLHWDAAAGFAQFADGNSLAMARNVMARGMSLRGLAAVSRGCAVACLASQNPTLVREALSWLDHDGFDANLQHLVKHLPADVLVRCQMALLNQSADQPVGAPQNPQLPTLPADALGRSLDTAIEARLDPLRMTPRQRRSAIEELRRSIQVGAGGKRGMQRSLEWMARFAEPADAELLRTAGAKWGLQETARLAIDAARRRAD